MPRRILVALLAVAAVGLTLTSVAFACTVVQGTTTVIDPPGPSPQKVKPGGMITATGSGAFSRNRPYTLTFLNFKLDHDQMNTCMSGKPTDPDQPIGGPTLSDNNGNIAATKGVIPLTAQPTPTGNEAWVCFINHTPIPYNDATFPAPLVVLGLP